MSKRIIVLSDGTGNSASQVWRTNVWRTFEALDLAGSDQVAFYDDGVGTSSFKPLAILGGAFGYGLKRNVIDIYKFICRNYCFAEDYQDAYKNNPKEGDPNASPPIFKDDDVFGFGFSRGAFTIRVVIGLCLDQGIVRADDEASLDASAKEAYRNYRANRFHSRTGFENIFRRLAGRDPRKKLYVVEKRDLKHIRFLGLWDTVAAYGLPVDEMTRGVSRYIWPLELPDRELDARVDYARHALSLDDQRTTFHPVLWNESKPSGATITKGERLVQVWFAGVHSNVGGGYPDDSLAYIPMYWIWREARDYGLRFKDAPSADPDAFLNAQSKQDKDGRLYDSRSGAAGYYRYGPRDVYELCNFETGDERDTVNIERPKIHETVFRRIKVGAHAYAPIGLPKTYDIVSYNPVTGNHDIHASGSAIPENSARAQTRYKDQLSKVWTMVWRGRGIYFLTVLASLYLSIYPLALTIPRSGEETSRLHFLSDVIRLVTIPLPHAADRWIDAYASDPGRFVVAALAIAILIGLGAGLRARVSDQMRGLFNISLDLVSPVAQSGAPKRADRKNKNGHSQDLIKDGAGNPTSEDSDNSIWRPRGWIERLSIAAIVIAGLIGIIIKNLGDGTKFPLIIQDFVAEFPTFLGWLAPIALITLFLPKSWVAHLRDSERYKAFIKGLRFRYAPAFFAFAFCVLGIVFITHYTLNVVDSFGGLCTATLPSNEDEAADRAAIQPICAVEADQCNVDDKSIPGGNRCDFGDPKSQCFGRAVVVDTSNLCTSTGIFLEQYHHYKVISSVPDEEQKNWRFGGVASSLRGTSIGALIGRNEDSCGGLQIWNSMPWGDYGRSACNYSVGAGRALLGTFLYPLKRTFEPEMGTLMLRYGDKGNSENYIYADAGEKPVWKLSEPFTATRNGELFVYLNKPAFGFGANWLRHYNSGKAVIKVVRIKEGAR